MPQEILTKEEAKRLDRFHELNREIVAGYKEAVSGQVRMLRAVWEITRDELWKLEYRKFADWLSFLYEAGVKYTARSTFYDKLGFVKKYKDIVGEDNAILLAAEYDGPLRLLETSQTVSFKKGGRGLTRRSSY